MPELTLFLHTNQVLPFALGTKSIRRYNFEHSFGGNENDKNCIFVIELLFRAQLSSDNSMKLRSEERNGRGR
jgi:hypothetical protein